MQYLSDEPQALDSTRDYELDLYGAGNTSVAGLFTGAETFAATVWLGEDLAPLASPLAYWLDAAADPPRIGLTVRPSDLATLAAPAVYRLRVKINPGVDDVVAFDGLLRLAPAPGAATPPRTYATVRDLDDLAPWISDNEAPASLRATNFLRPLELASRWLERQVLARAAFALDSQARRHAPVLQVDPIVPTTGIDAGPWWGPSVLSDTTRRDQLAVLRAALDAGHLMTGAADPDDVDGVAAREIVAHYALWLVLRNQVGGPNGSETSYQQFATESRRQALRLIMGWTARIDTDGDGVADYEVRP